MPIPEVSDQNLALLDGVQISTATGKTWGGGDTDPRILLNEAIHNLNGKPLTAFRQNNTYDTYTRKNSTHDLDWYALHFPEKLSFNCIEMTMGLAYEDGGWWTLLDVEVFRDETWQSVENLTITPNYNFDDTRAERRPYETHQLRFDHATGAGLRIIGKPGGSSHFTSLARIAVYHRDFSLWTPSSLPRVPVPEMYQLIPAQIICDLSENMVKLTGIAITAPLMKQYLDQERYAKHLDHVSKKYQIGADLWFLIGETLGWRLLNSTRRTRDAGNAKNPNEPYVQIRLNNTLANAVAPIVIDGRLLGDLMTYSVILKDHFDERWHRRFARRCAIPWVDYEAAIARSSHMSLEQMEGAAGLLGQIANYIAQLAYQNLNLQNELSMMRQISRSDRYRQEIVRSAIDYMHTHLETVSVIAEVAKAVALSVPHLNRLFLEQTGRNPGAYLIDLRLERAKYYLAHKSMSVMDVCVALNYSPSHFSRLFRARVGCTPSQYVNRQETSL